MKSNWSPFNSASVLASLGAKAVIKVRAPKREVTDVVITVHGQPIVKETGRLLGWAPEEMLLPEEPAAPKSAPEKPAAAP